MLIKVHCNVNTALTCKTVQKNNMQKHKLLFLLCYHISVFITKAFMLNQYKLT